MKANAAVVKMKKGMRDIKSPCENPYESCVLNNRAKSEREVFPRNIFIYIALKRKITYVIR